MARTVRVVVRAAAALLLGWSVVAGLSPVRGVPSILWPGTKVLAAAGAAQPADVLRVGVVDMQAVISQSGKGQRARAQLEAERAAKQKQLDAMEEEVRKLQAELERQKSVLSPNALREREETIQRKIQEARRTADDWNRESQKREAELVGEIQREILQAITEFGKEKGYRIVLERAAGVWYVGERADLTKDIIDRFNAKSGGKP